MQTVLYVLAEAIRHIAVLMQPFVPDSAARMLDQLAIPADKRAFASLTPAEALKAGTALPTPAGAQEADDEIPVLLHQIETAVARSEGTPNYRSAPATASFRRSKYYKKQACTAAPLPKGAPALPPAPFPAVPRPPGHSRDDSPDKHRREPVENGRHSGRRGQAVPCRPC